jgi:hypothetical protein
MTVSGISGSTSTNPMLAILQSQQQTSNALFGGAGGEPSDLTALTSTVAAYSLYQNPTPGLLKGLTQWDGSQTPGSQRTPAPTMPDAGAGAAAVNPTYSFNPFDQSTWDVNAPADASNPSSADATSGTLTGTGVVVAPPTYTFNPFDQSTWNVQNTTGNNVDIQA